MEMFPPYHNSHVVPLFSTHHRSIQECTMWFTLIPGLYKPFIQREVCKRILLKMYQTKVLFWIKQLSYDMTFALILSVTCQLRGKSREVCEL
jgi:hypothetical protein